MECDQENGVISISDMNNNNNIDLKVEDEEEKITHTQKRRTAAGKKQKFKETRHPIYRGVRKRNERKWVSEVREPNNKKSRIRLGTFPTPEMAARAYDVAVLALRGGDVGGCGGGGEGIILNFADSASSSLPRPRSSSAEDIRMAAFLAAEAFRPPTILQDNNDIQQPPSSSPVINVSSYSDCSSSSSSSTRMFVDEEEMFNMPVLINSMAEGLLLTPPAMKKGFQWNDDDDDFKLITSLWKDN